MSISRERVAEIRVLAVKSALNSKLAVSDAGDIVALCDLALSVLDAKPVEVRKNPDGTLDEVVGSGYVHLEQMDSGHWWIGIGYRDVLHINLHSRREITATVMDERIVVAE